MHTIIVQREKNLLIRFRALKVFIDDEFIDYIEPNEMKKIIRMEDKPKKINLKIDWCSSNEVMIDDFDSTRLTVTSQIQNGLFIYIFISFFGGGILELMGIINPYLGFATALPMTIIVFWQTIGRNNLMRLSKS